MMKYSTFRLQLFVTLTLVVLLVGVLTPATHAASDLTVLAQDPGGVTVRSTRSFIIESIVVVLLFGGALFAVCRSSRRS